MGTEEVVDLLDRYWFLLNVLKINHRTQAPPSLPPSLPSSPDKTKALGVCTPCHVPRKLLRAPSMPDPSRTRPEESSTTTCSRKILSVSTLARAPSLPVYCDGDDDDDDMQRHRDRSKSMSAKQSKLQRSSSSGLATLNPSIPRFRPPPRDRPAVQEKKWRSYSDLESFEVQGFKDLGFVFDGVASSGSLANVIPGLRDKKPSDGGRDGNGRVTRPYLSEAWWFKERVAHAPPKLAWAETTTGAEMKQQLRSWATAVACNAREEF